MPKMHSSIRNSAPLRRREIVATVILVWALAAPSLRVDAYEFATHAAITREAVMRSRLNPAAPDLLLMLGIADKGHSIGNSYLDFPGNGVAVERQLNPLGAFGSQGFGPRKIRAANSQSPFAPSADSVVGWLMLGAIREDDVPFDSSAIENTPQDEPGGTFVRVFNHFYDPYNHRALTVAAVLGAEAPDWALATVTPNGRTNNFNVAKARDAMWRAVTLKSPPLQGGIDLPFTPSADIPTKEALRTAYWATTFRALGDVVHLLQDMAQPQHTRNDAHSGLYCVSDEKCLGGHASYYEHYVDAKVTGESSFVLLERFMTLRLPQDATENVTIGPPNYGGYPIPRFADYASYFTTATGLGSLGGRGLANYSNQGFYSAGTNIVEGSGTSGYPSPPPNGQGLAQVVMANGTVKNAFGKDVRGTLTLFTGSVVDAATNTANAVGVRLSSQGMFDQFLSGASKRYTLNHYNYDDQMALLLPRAVAYSAGLLDYFFRGQMDIGLPDEGVYGIVDHAQYEPPSASIDPNTGYKGFSKLRLKLLNTTPPIITTPDSTSVQQPMSNGTVVAVFKFRRNLCYRDALDGEITNPVQMPICRSPAEEIVVSELRSSVAVPTAGPGVTGVPLTFAFPNPLPINAVDVVLQVVYRGQLGSESDAVVVATKDIPEPTFITTYNDTDRLLLGGKCYDHAVVASTDALWNQLSPTCKDTSVVPRKVSSMCANVPLNVRLSTVATAAPVVVAMEKNGAIDQRVLPRRFARFAVLGDPTIPTSMTVGFNNAPLSLGGGTSSQAQYPGHHVAQQTQAILVNNTTDNGYHYQVDTSTVVDAYVTHRGVRTWQGQLFVVDGTTASVSAPCPEADLDALKGNERYPMPVTITGWN
jgi:hypothetical protein